MDYYTIQLVEAWIRLRWDELRKAQPPKEFLSSLLMEGSEKFKLTESSIYSIITSMRKRNRLHYGSD